MACSSINLTTDENCQFQELVEDIGALRGVAVAQMYKSDSRSQWDYVRTGVVTVENSTRRSFVSLCMYDLLRCSRVWEQRLFKEMAYLDVLPRFHMFYGDDSVVGLSFADSTEASCIRNAVNEYVKGRKAKITRSLSRKIFTGKSTNHISSKTEKSTGQVTYDLTSLEHKEHIALANGSQLKVSASDRFTAKMLAGMLDGGDTVTNEEKMHPAMKSTNTVEVGKVVTNTKQGQGLKSTSWRTQTGKCRPEQQSSALAPPPVPSRLPAPTVAVPPPAVPPPVAPPPKSSETGIQSPWQRDCGQCVEDRTNFKLSSPKMF